MPNLGKDNYTVLCGAFGSRVIMQSSSEGNVEATGVEYVYENKMYTVKVKKEVILSAG